MFSTLGFPYKFNCFPMTFPTFIRISPSVLMISPQCTHDIPHCTHDNPRCTEHPPLCCTPRVYCIYIMQGETVHSRKFQITVEKCAPSFDLPFGTIMTKLKLFHVVERKMFHARQTFEINCQFDEKFDI